MKSNISKNFLQCLCTKDFCQSSECNKGIAWLSSLSVISSGLERVISTDGRMRVHRGGAS